MAEGSRAQNGGAGNIVYGTSINLRGLGPYSTLTLVDGHRAVSNGRSIDPSFLPSLGLQRIEVLAGVLCLAGAWQARSRPSAWSAATSARPHCRGRST